MIRNFKGTITKGKIVEPPVAFIGGVAANDGAVQAVRDAFSLSEEQLFVPELYAWMGAVGAALIEADAAAERAAATAANGRAGATPTNVLPTPNGCRRLCSRPWSRFPPSTSCCCAIWPDPTSFRPARR